MHNPAGCGRRIAALAYDILVAVAVLLIATLLVMPFAPKGGFPPHHPIFQMYLLIVLFLFHAWCWKSRGQTIGMVAWNMRIVSTKNRYTLTWTQCAIRFTTGILSFLLLGLGFFYALFNKHKKTIYDSLSDSRVIVMK
jgi:uncharacterized RDD family membrane protein YckC